MSFSKRGSSSHGMEEGLLSAPGDTVATDSDDDDDAADFEHGRIMTFS